MLVAQAFQKQGAGISQSDYYIDYETGKPREIDVVAKWYRHRETLSGLAELEVYYCIECKSQQKKPWLIFSAGPGKKRSFVFPPASKDGSKFTSSIWKSLSTTQLYGTQHAAGYGVTQAFTDGKDIPYGAINSAIKAAIHSSSIPDRYRKHNKEPVVEKHFWPTLALPVVVTDGKLFECCLDDSNKPTVKECGFAAVEWKYPRPNEFFPTASLVYIYTVESLDLLLKHAVELNQVLFDRLEVPSSL